MMISPLPPPLPTSANASGLSEAGALCPGTSPDLQGYVELKPTGLGEITPGTKFAVVAAAAVLVAGSMGYYARKQKQRERKHRRMFR